VLELICNPTKRKIPVFPQDEEIAMMNLLKSKTVAALAVAASVAVSAFGGAGQASARTGGAIYEPFFCKDHPTETQCRSLRRGGEAKTDKNRRTRPAAFDTRNYARVN
jgi:hypothetical protein